jgi:iron-sulfur cluster repair protein YtfE (RIC family)
MQSIHRGHESQPVMVAELQALGDALRATASDLESLAGRTLYLHFSRFAAELLLHMAEEEQVVQPLLERFFSDDELRAIHGRLLASMTTPETMRSGPWLLRAVNPTERAALVASVAATAPRAEYEALLDLARSVLSSAEYADLVSRTRP